MALIDTDNLSYVAKNYENEVKETTRRIYAQDTVNNTIARVNEKLDKLLTSINAKYDFMRDKMYGAGGIDDFVKSTHKDIDNISTDSSDFVDTNLQNTKSHPSINAFKVDRSYSAYKMLDFKNQSIKLNKDTLTLSLKNIRDLDPSRKIHTFRINLDSEEALKIVEFAITYRQDPNLITISDNEVYKEPTVQIERVIKGKFFIIRHDPINEPSQIIVKAIIDNTDNTSNVLNEDIIDIPASLDGKTVSHTDEGPEFDLYFKVSSQNTLDICIGNIVPYKWLIQKNYVTIDDLSDKKEFSIVSHDISHVKVSKVYYSRSLGLFFIVDEESKKIYTTSDNSLEMSTLTQFTRLEYDGRFELFDTGSVCVISNNEASIIFTNDITQGTYLGTRIYNAKRVSTGEIVVNVGNNSLYLIDPDSFDLGIKLIDFSTEDDFENSIEYFEYEPGVLMCFVGHKDSITCHVFKTNITTNTYADSEYRSNSFKHQIERLSGINCVSGKIFAIQKVDKSIIIALTYKSASDNEISSVIKFSDFTIDNRDIAFNSIEVLKKFNIVNKEFSSFSDVITKVISTSLFDFAITNENKLLIIDDKYVIDALTFTKETKEVQVTDSKGNTTIEVQDLGYSDKNSVLFMRPDVNESQYYNSNEIFLQNVFDVFENQDRVYICDKYGIYELLPNKNLKNRFYSQGGKIYNIVANIVKQNVSYGLLYCKSSDDTSVSVFKHNYEVKDVSDEKLRYNYIDLHNSDWQIFDPENLVYDPNKKIIEMNGIIYVSIVDRMSSLFNTNKNINYSTSLNVFEDIDPNIVHTNQFVVDGNNVVKEVPVVKFNFTVIKYGVVNYYGSQLKDGIKNVSDINELKSYILIHKPTDGLTLKDYRKVIINKLKEEALEDHDPQTVRKYILNPDKPKRLVYSFSKVIGSGSFNKVIDIKGRKYGMMSIDSLLPGNKYKYIDSNFAIDDLFVNVCKPITGKNFAYELNLISEMTKNGLYQYNLDLKTQNVKLRYRKDYSSDSFDPTYQDGMFEKVVGSINDIITNFDYDLFDKKNKYFDILEVQNNDFLIYRGSQTIKYVNLRDPNGKVIIFDDTAISESNPFGSDICGEDSSIVFNRFKIINNELYLWSDKAKLGLYKFNTVTKTAEVVLNKVILDYIIDDVIINENNQIIATIDSTIDKNTASYKKYMYTKIIDNVINNILNNSPSIKLISDPNSTDYKQLDPDLFKFGISIIYSFRKLVSTSDSITIPSIETAEPTSNMLTYVNQFITTANNCVKLIDSSYVLFDASSVLYQATETNGWSGYAIVKSKVHTKDSFDFTFKTRPASFFENKYNDAIFIENSIVKTIVNPNSNIHGLSGKVIYDSINENYVLGLFDGIATVDKNDFNKIKFLKLKTVIGRDIPFIPKIINGSLFVVANENVLSDRIYKLTYDHVIENYVPEEYSFMDPEDTSCRMNVKDFVDLGKYGCYLIAENTETGMYNYYQYVSENKTSFGENAGVYVEDSSIPAVMKYNTTLKSNDNFGILSVDGRPVYNLHLNPNGHIKRFFTGLKRFYKHSNQETPEGSWITDPQDPTSKIFKTTVNYYAINGDLTKWSVAYNGSEKEHDLYYFEPNEPKTYEPVNKNITQVPLEGFDYYRKSGDQYISIGKLTNWNANTDYYRLSGTWKLAEPEIISAGEKTLYFTEDIETVAIPIIADYSVDMGDESPAEFDFEAVTDAINKANGNSFNEVTGKSTIIKNDKYEISYIVADGLNRIRWNIDGVVEKDKSDIILIQVQDIDSKTTTNFDTLFGDLTGKDPYSTPSDQLPNVDSIISSNPTIVNKKSLIYDAKNSIYDIDSVKDKTNYACVFIEKLFDTSLGKFVVSNGNLHLISDDYKQIISNLDTGSENYYVYEDKSKEEPRVFVCNFANNIVKIYSKITRKLVETPVASVKIISMFNDDAGNLYGLSSINDKYIVYKFNDSTNVFEKIWETPSNISVNTEIGFVTHDIADDLHETFIIGNGDYNFYKFNGVDFTPVFTIYNKYNSPVVKVEVLPNADIIVKFKSDSNETPKTYYSIIIKQNDEIKELFESNDWVSVTSLEDKILPNGFLQHNSNIFFKEFEKMLFENKLEANNSNKLVLLPNTTCLPIVVNGELIYPDGYADPETIEQDPDNHFVVYDSDGVTPAYYNIHFDKMVETSKGIFAVAGNEIFRNDLNTNGNGFFMTVGKGLHDSDYVNIIECRHGIFYCDNKNVMKFNEAENKFEIIPQTVATNSDTNKITFIECFNEGLIIASKPKHLSNAYNETQYPEFKIPGIFEWYNSSTNSFKRLYESSDLISNGFDSTNLIQIGDVKEASKGLFITLVQKNKLIVIQLYRDIFAEPSINYFSKTLDPNSGNSYNSVIANVFESEDGNIYIQHSVDFGDSSSLFASALYILNENELESVQNGINTLTIVNTIEGIFGIFDNIPLVNDLSSVNSENNAKMFGKLKEVESISTINGKQIHYLDIDDTFDPDFVNKVNEDKSYVKLCQEKVTKRIFAFVFNDSVAKDGVVTGNEVYKFYLDIYELNFSTGKFELLPNSRINITDSYETLMNLSGISNERTKKYNPYLIEDFEVLDYNGILFFKLFGNQIYRYGDYKLKYENTNVKAKRDEVLYDLKIVFENPDKYNNLPEETANSEIDKFVIKEVGLVNPVVEKEHDKIRRVTQFFMPHNYYNRASGIVNSVIMDPTHPETGEPKEYFRVHNTKQLYNLVYNGFKRNNLINSRFIKDNQDIISDTFVHKTNDVLGDIEKYLQNTDCFRIELRIYPVECLGTSDDHINKTIRFSDSEAPTKFKKTIVDPYDPDED